MPNHTPPRYWNYKGQAQKWLVDFISDVADYKSWTIGDMDDLYDEIITKVRRGWKTMLVLRRPFRRNPDALLAFVEEFLTKRKGQD